MTVVLYELIDQFLQFESIGGFHHGQQKIFILLFSELIRVDPFDQLISNIVRNI